MSNGIYAAMANILAEFPVVKKGRKNDGGGGYMFRGIDDVYVAAHDLLAKHSVFPVPHIDNMDFDEVGQTKGGAKQFRCTVHGSLSFYHADGSFIVVGIAGEGIDMGDKGGMKAISNAIKYAYWNTFCVPSAEPKDSEAFPDVETTPNAVIRTKAKPEEDDDDDEDYEPKGRR